jgi:hypothetical protein
VRQELARDWWLVRQGQLDNVIWEFTPSPITGNVGPSPALLEEIQKLGFGSRNELSLKNDFTFVLSRVSPEVRAAVRDFEKLQEGFAK